MRLTRPLRTSLMLLVLAWPVSGCGGRASLPAPTIAVSAVDAATASRVKPAPTVAILTDPVARERYNATVETWGESVSLAWGRICRSLVAQGVEVACPVAAKR